MEQEMSEDAQPIMNCNEDNNLGTGHGTDANLTQMKQSPRNNKSMKKENVNERQQQSKDRNGKKKKATSIEIVYKTHSKSKKVSKPKKEKLVEKAKKVEEKKPIIKIEENKKTEENKKEVNNQSTGIQIIRQSSAIKSNTKVIYNN